MDTIEIDREMTTEEREHALEVALVIRIKELIEAGNDLYDVIDMLAAAGCPLDEGLIAEMDRQGIIWI